MSWLQGLIVRIKGDNSDLKRSLKDSEKSVKGFGDSVKPISGLIKGAFTVASISAFIKSVLSATDALSDKFSFAVAGAKGALTEFFRMTANADFSNFFANVSDAFIKAKSLAEEIDALNEKQAYVGYKTSGLKQEAAIQEEIVRDKTGKYTLERRKQAARDLKEIELDIKKTTLDALDDTYTLESRAWENRNKMTVDKGNELYQIIASLTKEQQDKLNELWSAANSLYGAGAQVDKARVKMVRERMGADVTDEQISAFKEYLDLVKTGEEDVVPKLYGILQRYNEGATNAQERFNGVLRITNALLGEQTDILSSNEVIPKKVNKIPSFRSIKISGIPQPQGIQDATTPLKDTMSKMEKILTEGRDMAADLSMQIVESIGQMFGGAKMKDVGKELLLSLSNFMAQFGKLLITLGLGMDAFVKSLTTMNPIIAITAGLALIAAAGAIKGLMDKGPSVGGHGGGSRGGSYTSSGSYATAAPRETLVAKLRGKDIEIALRRT